MYCYNFLKFFCTLTMRSSPQMLPRFPLSNRGRSHPTAGRSALHPSVILSIPCVPLCHLLPQKNLFLDPLPVLFSYARQTMPADCLRSHPYGQSFSHVPPHNFQSVHETDSHLFLQCFCLALKRTNSLPRPRRSAQMLLNR